MQYVPKGQTSEVKNIYTSVYGKASPLPYARWQSATTVRRYAQLKLLCLIGGFRVVHGSYIFC